MRRMWNVVALVLAAILVLTFLDQFVLVRLLGARIGLPLAFAILEVVAIIGAGALVRRFRCETALNFVVGYPIFGTICFLVGLLRVSAATMLPIMLLFAVAGAYALYRHHASRGRSDDGASALIRSPELTDEARSEARGRRLDDRDSAPRPTSDLRPPTTSIADRALHAFSLIAIAVVLLAGFVAAQAPPASLDELAYHLAIPQSWVAEGRAVDLPLISHSYFPLGIESADLPLLASLGQFGGGTASHFLHLIAAIATIVVVHRATNRNLLLTAAIVTTPALALTAGWSLVDWPLLGIFAVLADALRRDEDDPTIAAAIAAGLLAKYTFVPFAIVMLIVARRVRGVGPGVVAGSVFFIRNLVLTGNPVAPFFSANAPHVAGYRSLVLASYIFDGRFIDESLGASLLSTALFAAGGIGLAALAMGVVLFVLAPSARILVPFFSVAATRATDAVTNNRMLRIVVIIAIAGQLLLVGYFIDRTQVFSTMSGKWSDDEYLTNARSTYPAVAWVNSALPENSRTLVVGLHEMYWFSHPVRGGGNFDGPRVSSYLDVPTPEALRARLAHDGITHVAVFAAAPPTAVAQKVAERQTQLTKPAQRSLAQMLDRYASSVSAHPSVTLFTLK